MGSSFKKTNIPKFPNELISSTKPPVADKQINNSNLITIYIPPKVNPPVSIIKPISPPQSIITPPQLPSSAPKPIKINPPTQIIEPPKITPIKPLFPFPSNTYGVDCIGRSDQCCCTHYIDNAGNNWVPCINDLPVTLIPKGQERNWLPPSCNGGFENGCGVWIKNCLYRKVPFQNNFKCGCKFYVPPSQQTCEPKIRSLRSPIPPFKTMLFKNVPWNPTISRPPRECIPIDSCLFCPVSSQPIVDPPTPPPPPPNAGIRRKETWYCTGQKKSVMMSFYPKGMLNKAHPEIIGYALCGGFRRECPIAENISDAMKLATFFNCSFYITNETTKEIRLRYITK